MGVIFDPILGELRNELALIATVVSTGSVDLNNYTNDGHYIFTSGATLTNAPHANGYLMVISNNPITTSGQGNNVKQMWFRMGTNGTNDMNTLVRSRNGGSWSSWVQYVMTNDSTAVNFTGTVTIGAGSLRSGPVARSANVTLSSTSPYNEVIDASGGDVTITLPSASVASGLMFCFFRKDSSANNVNIARAGTDTINGGTSNIPIAANKGTMLFSDGTSAWFAMLSA